MEQRGNEGICCPLTPACCHLHVAQAKITSQTTHDFSDAPTKHIHLTCFIARKLTGVVSEHKLGLVPPLMERVCRWSGCRLAHGALAPRRAGLTPGCGAGRL